MATQTEDLAALLANPLNRIVARCAQNAIALDADQLTLASFVECNFPGYAPIDRPEFEMEDSEDDNYAEAVSDLLHFEAGEITTPQAITAIYLTLSIDDGPEALLYPFPFEVPYRLTSKGQGIDRQVRMISVVEDDEA